jgi:hypothetical protein
MSRLHPRSSARPRSWKRNFGSRVKSSAEAAIKDPTAVISRINPSRSAPWDFVGNSYAAGFFPVPGRRYFMHFDLSKNRDATGIALCHRERPKMCVDFMLEVRPKPDKDINYGQLREVFVYPLVKRGFILECISFDGFQSEETRQVLEERGLHTDSVSVDKTTEPYDTVIELILDDQLDFYGYRPFTQQLEELRLVNGLRYDHPKRFKDGSMGRKDVSDAVAGCVFSAVRYERENPEPPPPVMVIARRGYEKRLNYEQNMHQGFQGF